MPAPTRYTRQQQDLILALSARGMSSTEIATLCAEGTETIPPFKIPDRSVRSLIQRHGRDQRSSDPRQQDPPETDKPFMVRSAERDLRDHESGRVKFGDFWTYMARKIETAREYFDTEILEHHPEWAEHLPGAVETVPKPHVPSDVAEVPESGNDSADASEQTPPGYAQARIEGAEEDSQARNAPDTTGGIEDRAHAQGSSPSSHGNQPPGALEEARQLIAENAARPSQERLEAELERQRLAARRKRVIGMRRTDNAR